MSLYAKPEFNILQIKEIRKGLEKGLDVSVYAKPEYSWKEMREIRKKIEELPIEVVEEAKERCKRSCKRKKVKLKI